MIFTGNFSTASEAFPSNRISSSSTSLPNDLGAFLVVNEAVEKFPVNINVAASLSIACNMDIDVKIIVDPKVDRNVHEVVVKGDFGEFRTSSENYPFAANPKTSMLAAFSAIKLLKSFGECFSVGT